MKIGDEVYIHGFVDEIRKDTVIIRNKGGYFGTDAEEVAPTVERKKGKWIDEPVYKQTMDGKTLDGYTYCSECREMHEYWYRSNYCPSCGADMRKGEEE